MKRIDTVSLKNHEKIDYNFQFIQMFKEPEATKSNSTNVQNRLALEPTKNHPIKLSEKLKFMFSASWNQMKSVQWKYINESSTL